jgi:hypothetical protein
MGLTVSAEEIIRDRKILKRESFLNLSWNSYLMSKLIILFTLSAIQTFLFVLIGNLILEIQWGMLLPFTFVLFTVSCMANVLGLNISSAFNSAVTVYVMIPLLLIPQMILSGLLFSFDKLNNIISTKGKVPIVADMMASRWAYEAMAVYQFKNNSYEQPYFVFEKIEATADFKSSFLIDELNRKRKYIADNIAEKSDSIRAIMQKDLEIIRTSLAEQDFKKGMEDVKFDQPWPLAMFTPAVDKRLEDYLAELKKHYQTIYNKAVAAREGLSQKMENDKSAGYRLNDYKNRYFNESLSDLVRNISEKDRIIEFDGRLIQQINPVFLSPKGAPNLSYRTHFFAPEKNLLGMLVSTYWFDTLVIWLMTVCLYITLYFELLRKLINSFDKMPGKGMLTKGLPKVNSSKNK